MKIGLKGINHCLVMFLGLLFCFFAYSSTWANRQLPKSGISLTSMKKSSEVLPPSFFSSYLYRDSTSLAQALGFLQADPKHTSLLFQAIEKSKTDPVWATAASNSLSLLVLNQVPLVHMDFSYAKLPYVILSHAFLFHCSFDHADLHGAKLDQACLQGTSFRGANLHGAFFGEKENTSFKEQVNDRVDHITYSPNGNTAAVVTSQGKIQCYDLTRGKLHREWKQDDQGRWNAGMAFLDNHRLFTITVDGLLSLWNIDQGKLLHQRMLSVSAPIRRLFVSSSTGVLVVLGAHMVQPIKLYDLTTLTPLKSLDLLYADFLWGVSLSQDQRYLTFVQRGTLYVWDLKEHTYKYIYRNSRMRDVIRTDMMTKKGRIACLAMDMTLFILQPQRGHLVLYQKIDIKKEQGYIRTFTFTPDGHALLLLTSKGKLLYQEIGKKKNTLISTLPLHILPVGLSFVAPSLLIASTDRGFFYTFCFLKEEEMTGVLDDLLYQHQEQWPFSLSSTLGGFVGIPYNLSPMLERVTGTHPLILIGTDFRETQGLSSLQQSLLVAGQAILPTLLEE